jgi:hypothetical protein
MFVKRDDANRVAVLAGHQVVDGGFEIGLAEISLYDGRTELSVITDDEKINFDRGRSAQSSNSGASTQLPTLQILKSKHNGEAVKPQSITACGMHLAVVKIASHPVPIACPVRRNYLRIEALVIGPQRPPGRVACAVPPLRRKQRAGAAPLAINKRRS